jgi:hypothetical protein
MSYKTIPTTATVIVCDLCGEPIDTYANKDRAALNWGTTPMANLAPPEPKHFLFFRRRPRVPSTPEEMSRKQFQWDFHGECLVDTLEPIITERSATP